MTIETNRTSLTQLTGRITRAMSAAAIGALATVAAHAQTYTLTPIAQGDPKGLNERGVVVGNGPVNGVNRGFIWRPSSPNGTSGTLSVLAALKGKVAAAEGLNYLGDVVGRTMWNGTGPLPDSILWPNGGSAASIAYSGSIQDQAYGINDAGNVCMMVNGGTSGVLTYLSKVISGKRKFFHIGSGWPTDINSRGQILMHSHAAGITNVWTPATPNGTTGSASIVSGSSWGFDLNEHGQVAGQMGVQVGTYQPNHGYLYLPAPAYGLPAGTNDISSFVHAQLPPPASGEWFSSWAGGVNDFGTVVGSAQAYVLGVPGETDHACWIWDSVNGARELTVPGWDLDAAMKINNAGQVLCRATQDGGLTYWTVLLTPQ